MALDVFIAGLYKDGSATVGGDLLAFTEEEQQEAVRLLHVYYTADMADMPGQAPAFDEGSALWAAKFMYRAIQLTFLRHVGAEEIPGLLPPFMEERTAAAMYSADLSLRHMQGVLTLVRGLAPEDPLIVHLKKVMKDWPLSTVGMESVEEQAIDVILQDESLRREFIDRIIDQRDGKKAALPGVSALVEATLGEYGKVFWPGYRKPELNLDKP